MKNLLKYGPKYFCLNQGRSIRGDGAYYCSVSKPMNTRTQSQTKRYGTEFMVRS